MTPCHTVTTCRRIGSLLLIGLALCAVVLAACGIGFSEEPEETELFKSLSVDGVLLPGEPLTLALEYEQPYTVAIDVRCDVLDADPDPTATPAVTATPYAGRSDITPPPTVVRIPRVRPTPVSKVLDILAQEIPANADGGVAGEVTPVPGRIEQRFFGPEAPGRYWARCFTPLDVNNAITRGFTIAEAEE